MLTPRDYQLKGAYFLGLRAGALLGDGVGLGKTITALTAIKEANLRKVLIIAPKPLKDWWREASINLVPTGADITLAHYEEFRSHREGRKTIKNKPSEHTQQYLKQRWDAVICDEAHKIKNRKSQRAKWVKRLNTTHKWALTGTPVAEYPQDLWSILNWLDPKTYSSYWTFVRLYCEIDTAYANGRSFEKIVGVKRTLNTEGRWTKDITLELLTKKVSNLMLVRRLEDVGLELPPVTVSDIPLTLADSQAQFYQEVKKQTVIELTEQAQAEGWNLSSLDSLVIRSAGARFMRLQQVASAPTVFKPELDNSKLDWLEDYLDNSGKPAVILTRFRHTVDCINELVEGKGFTVGTYETLGEGHNLQHYDTLIAWDAPKSRLDWEQAMGRIRRMGQERPQHVIRLANRDTVDEHCWNLIDKKDNEVNIIVAWLRGVLNGDN